MLRWLRAMELEIAGVIGMVMGAVLVFIPMEMSQPVPDEWDVTIQMATVQLQDMDGKVRPKCYYLLTNTVDGRGTVLKGLCPL